MFKEIVKKIYFSSVIKPSDLLSTLFAKPTREKKCSFIRMDILGDNFVFLPFLFKYKELYPDSLWIINATTAPLYSLLGLEYIPVIEKKFRISPFYRFNVLNTIFTTSFEMAVNLVPHRAQVYGDEILRIIKAKKKVCYGNDFIARKFQNNNMCNLVVNYDYNNSERQKPYVHIFNHEKYFFEKLIDTSLRQDTRRFYEIAYDRLKGCINYKINLNNNYIVIMTDASASFRQYARKNWQMILSNLPGNCQVVQLGLNKFSLQHPKLIDLTGKTSLEEAMSIIMNASLVIGNETGLTHLAYLSGVPTVCILGGGHFGRFLPWPEFDDVVKCVYKSMECFQCGWRCKYVNLRKGEVPPCISEIPVETLLEAIGNLNDFYKIFT